MNEKRPQDNELLRPDLPEFGNIMAGISIRGALEAVAGKSRVYILFKDKKGVTYPIPKIRFEWHELMIVVDITFLNVGGWTYEMLASASRGSGEASVPLNQKMTDLLEAALYALRQKMESGGSFSNALF